MKEKIATTLLVSLLIGVNATQAMASTYTPADLVTCIDDNDNVDDDNDDVDDDNDDGIDVDMNNAVDEEFIYITVKIQPGDTLCKLAVEHKTSVENLLFLNPHIDNPNLIYAGEQLTVCKYFAPGIPESLIECIKAHHSYK